jgi:2-polyprenyl-3-methyl-5-hydroxy-6-metoxy-1,4-benzoquinol methylase
MRYVENFMQQFGIKKGDEVLDLGCGTGRAAKVMCKAGIFVHGMDLTTNSLNEDMKELDNFYFSQECLWQLGTKVHQTDYIFCADVMEHIPEKLVHPVLFQIAKKMLKGGFFSISTALETCGPKFINQQLHMTVRGGRWWADQLKRYWEVSFAQDPSNNVNYLYYVKVRKETDAK